MSTTPEGAEARAETLASIGVHHVGVCIDGSPVSERILPHGLAMARAFGATLTVLHVLEPHRPNERPTSTDLLDWEIRRTDARRHLDGISAEYGSPELPVETELLEGRAAEEISGWVASHHVDLTVLCSHGRSGWTDWSLASTAKKLIEALAGPTLLVPASALQEPPKREVIYERILVPLDASPRAESVLPMVARLARVHDSELVLSHIVPVPELTAPVPLDEEELKLEQHLVGRNTRVAESYLALVSGRLAGQGLRARTVLADDDDVRFGLLRCISEERPDLVVLSGHGRSGRTDLPLGSVASFLLEHATTPLLIVREKADGGDSVIPKHRHSDSGRLPSLATT
jgi:nucleotide-binding universal stress UspA family protein